MARVYFLRSKEFSYSLLGLDSFPTFYLQCFQSCELSLSVPLCEDCGLHNFLGAIFLFWGRPLSSRDKVTFAVFPGHRASQSHGSRVCIPTASCVFHVPRSIPISLHTDTHPFFAALCLCSPTPSFKDLFLSSVKCLPR